MIGAQLQRIRDVPAGLLAAALAAGLGLTGCASVGPEGPVAVAGGSPPAQLSAPVQEPRREPQARSDAGPPPWSPVGLPTDAHGRVRGYNRPYQVKDQWYSPQYQPGYDQVGIASWYGYESGRTTANGEAFLTDEVASAAHTTLPIPSLLEVTNLENGRTIQVRLNDRGPFVPGRLIDLSREAARELGFLEKGTARVRVRYLGPAPFVPPTPVMQYASAAPVGGSGPAPYRPASSRAASPPLRAEVVDDPMSLVAGLAETTPAPQR